MANGNQQPTFAGQKVSPAMARAVSAFSASIEAEGQRRSRMGLSGAGFAAGFKEAMSPIIDYSDMLEGNAAPGTVLFDAAMKSAEDKNKDLESKGVDFLQVDEVDEVDEQEGEFPDLLARPVETEEADVVPNTIRQAIEEGTVELPEGFRDKPELTFDQVVAMTRDFGPDPKVGMTRNLPGANTQAAALRYSKPVSFLSPGVRVSITEEEAMRRKEISRSDPNTLPEATQQTGEGNTAYRSVVGVGGRPFIPGQFAGGRAVPAE